MSEALTIRELQVVRLTVLGHNRESIANQLGIAENTVKQHKENIYRKLGVSSEMEMVLKLYDLKEKAGFTARGRQTDAIAEG